VAVHRLLIFPCVGVAHVAFFHSLASQYANGAKQLSLNFFTCPRNAPLWSLCYAVLVNGVLPRAHGRCRYRVFTTPQGGDMTAWWRALQLVASSDHLLCPSIFVFFLVGARNEVSPFDRFSLFRSKLRHSWEYGQSKLAWNRTNSRPSIGGYGLPKAIWWSVTDGNLVGTILSLVANSWLSFLDPYS
jgi:hypothetical protein